jgi:hypothetical protein
VIAIPKRPPTSEEMIERIVRISMLRDYNDYVKRLSVPLINELGIVL